MEVACEYSKQMSIRKPVPGQTSVNIFYKQYATNYVLN